MRVIFVDGPGHSQSMSIEGNPPDILYVPAIGYLSVKMYVENMDAFRFNYTHVYRLHYKTKAGTIIYVYEGES